MTVHRVVIIGAGAAGLAAAAVLARSEGIAVTLIAKEAPYIRMHINGVAFGFTSAETIQAATPDVTLLLETVASIDPHRRTVTVTGGATSIPFDSLIVATGSHPRFLDDLAVDGLQDPAVRRRVLTLHSLEDAERIRTILTRTCGAKSIAVDGGGFTGAEAVSALREAGHRVALISRSRTPGLTAFGPRIAARIADAHRTRVTSFLGRTISALRREGHLLRITLDDTATLSADLLIVAHGNSPSAPKPFDQGIDVEDRLRAGHPRIYGAGGAATHHDNLIGVWRIDHWADAAAQGAHAAAVLLHDHVDADDPGPYRPRSPHGALIHGMAISGIGYTSTGDERASLEYDIVAHTVGEKMVGVTGIDQVTLVHETAARIHEPAPVERWSRRIAPTRE